MRFLSLLAAFAVAVVCSAHTHTFHFNATHLEANPDGTHPRRVIGINGQWPIPTIRIKKHDRVVIHYTNGLEGQNLSLHFHGLFQKGANAMDGAEMITQCPIPPGHSFTYNFTVDSQAGTYWYHSHSGPQYSDGLRGVFIVEDENQVEYDEEVVLSVSDWYHTETAELMSQFLSRFNPTGAEPVPQNALFNDSRNVTWDVRPETTYLVRLVNMGMFVSQYVYIEDHELTIVEVDGVRVQPQTTDSLYLAVAQRVSFLVTTKASASKNYRFVNVLDKEMLDVQPEDLETVSTNWMVYNTEKPLPTPLKKESYDAVVGALSPFDDFGLIPLSRDPLHADYDYQITLNFTMENLGDGVNYAMFNGKAFTMPKVPTLFSVFSGGEWAAFLDIYGSNTNTYVLQHNEVVEIVLNNMDPGKHPFHLHGHNFQVVARSTGTEDEDEPQIYDPENSPPFPEIPVSRDTVLVNPNGYVVIRFKADNPGVWFFHCHVDWHLEQGLAITLVEAPLELQLQALLLPKDHFEACKLSGVPSQGNAAGRYGDRHDWFNLAGENLQVAPLPEGFTAKGYYAMAICALAAIYGVFTIYRFGIQDVSNADNDALLKKLYGILHEHGTSEGESMVTLDSEGERAATR